jgi:uncharacterized membrane protein YidH (DUF202 family)
VSMARVASGIGGVFLASAGLIPLVLGIRAMPDSIRMMERSGESGALVSIALAYSVLLTCVGVAAIAVGALVIFASMRADSPRRTSASP